MKGCMVCQKYTKNKEIKERPKKVKEKLDERIDMSKRQYDADLSNKASKRAEYEAALERTAQSRKDAMDARERKHKKAMELIEKDHKTRE